MVISHAPPNVALPNILRGIVPTVTLEWADTPLTNPENITDGDATTFANAASTELGAGYAGKILFTLPKTYQAIMVTGRIGFSVSAGNSRIYIANGTDNEGSFVLESTSANFYDRELVGKMLYNVSAFTLAHYLTAASTSVIKIYELSAFEVSV